MPVIFILIYTAVFSLLKTAARFLIQYEELILKLIWKCDTPGVMRMVLKRRPTWKLTLSHFKTYQMLGIKTVWHCCKDIEQNEWIWIESGHILLYRWSIDSVKIFPSIEFKK